MRTSLMSGEDLKLKIIILSENQPSQTGLYWRDMGSEKYEKIALTHVARGVYSVVIPAGKIKKTDIEYHIKIMTKSGQELYYPATAPQMNQTVVVID